MKSTPFARTMIGLLAALCLLGAACGNDDDAAPPTPAAPATTSETLEATAGHSEPAAVDDSGSEHVHGSIDDSDDGHEHTAMDEGHDEDGHAREENNTDGHHHDHDTLMEVDYEPVPTIELRTHLDPSSGVNLEVITTGFTLAPERASTEPVDGEGHFHIYVDGVKLRRLYAHWAHIDLTEPGDYEIRVEMSANNHAALAVNGERLDATALVTIPGNEHDQMSMENDAVDGGIAIEVEVSEGRPVGGVQRHQIDAGDVISIVVTGDTADELHIHGYDLVVGFSPGQPGSITFEADIPGIFEVETHHHGDLVMELQVG